MAEASLRRALSLRDLVAYGLAYVSPLAPLTLVGFVWTASGGAIGAAYLLAVLGLVFTLASYSTMTRLVPSAGSAQGYAAFSIGPRAGFVAGWMLALDYLLVPSLTTVLVAANLNALYPGVPRWMWIVLVLGVALAVNWLGMKRVADVSAFSVVAQLLAMGAVLALAVAALAHGRGHLSSQPFWNSGQMPQGSLVQGLGLCVFSFLGFDAVANLAEEVDDDARNLVPRALTSVFFSLAAMSLLAAWIFGSILPALTLKSPETAPYDMVNQIAPHWVTALLTWLIAVVVGITNIMPMQSAISRVVFSLARAGDLPRPLARVHSRSGVPTAALITTTAVILATALVFEKSSGALALLISVGAMAGFASVHLSVLAARRRHLPDELQRPQRMAAVLAVMGLIVCVVIGVGAGLPAVLMAGAWLVLGLLLTLGVKRRGVDSAKS